MTHVNILAALRALHERAVPFVFGLGNNEIPALAVIAKMTFVARIPAIASNTNGVVVGVLFAAIGAAYVAGWDNAPRDVG